MAEEIEKRGIRVFSGISDTVDSEMNHWLKDNPTFTISKMATSHSPNYLFVTIFFEKINIEMVKNSSNNRFNILDLEK